MAEQIYRYKAFISYRHVDRDRRWAKWLIDGLETFRTPRALLSHGIPSHIGHLFRDDDEIPASSNLSNQIEEALKASQFLIVVCSPDTPHSMWCRHEIDYFRKLGKGDRILALLVEGEPEDSFPPELLHVPYEVVQPDGSKTIELRDEEPIAADVRPRSDEPRSKTERRALIRIAATLLGCAFDDLAQRDHQRALHRQRLIGAAIAAVLLVAAGLGGWLWDYNRIKTAYYADVGSRWAEPFGIGKIDSDGVAHRWASYEIESQRGHVVRVRRVNGSGGLRALKGDEIDSDPWNTRAAEWRVRYAGDSVSTVEVFGATGRLLRTETYDFVHGNVVKYTQSSGTSVALSSNITAFQTRTSAGNIKRRPDVTQHRLTFTPEGYVARRVFETVWGTRAQDENGTSGRLYVYSASGQPVSVRVLSSSDAMLVGAGGAAEERRTYTAAGDLARFEWRDPHGALLSALDIGRDGRGNPVDKQWRGPDDKPVLNVQDLIAEERDEFDDRGNLVRGRFFDEAHRPMPCSLGYAQYANTYDALGRVTRTSYFNAAGAPVLSSKNVASATTVLDGAGNVVGIHTFGLNGKATISVDGYSSQITRFDDAGLPVEVRYYGPDGKLMLNPDGLAILRTSYDPRGNAVEQAWFDTHDRPVNSEGYARQTWTYDEQGNLKSEEYFGLDGKRALRSTSGIAGKRFFYTDHGYLAQIDFIGLDGGPYTGPDGYAQLTFDYDERGNPTRETFRGPSGERVMGPDGFSGLVQDYNSDDEIAEQHMLDTADKPVISRFGYANVRTRYDAHGNDVETLFLDAGGKPISARKGYARVVKAFDASRREIEERYFDPQGKPVIGTDGFAVERFRYDRRGLKIETSAYDVAMRPVVGPTLGFATERDTYDSRGQLVEVGYYDARGRLVVAADGYALRKASFDDAGNQVDLAYYKANGRLVMYRAPGAAFGFARRQQFFRPGGELERRVYYVDETHFVTVWAVPHRSK